jgi:hypothetical protein
VFLELLLPALLISELQQDVSRSSRYPQAKSRTFAAAKLFGIKEVPTVRPRISARPTQAEC